MPLPPLLIDFTLSMFTFAPVAVVGKTPMPCETLFLIVQLKMLTFIAPE